MLLFVWLSSPPSCPLVHWSLVSSVHAPSRSEDALSWVAAGPWRRRWRRDRALLCLICVCSIRCVAKARLYVKCLQRRAQTKLVPPTVSGGRRSYTLAGGRRRALPTLLISPRSGWPAPGRPPALPAGSRRLQPAAPGTPALKCAAPPRAPCEQSPASLAARLWASV